MTPYTVAAYIYLVYSRFLNIWWRLRSKQQWYRVDSQCFNLLSLEYLSVSNSMTISRVSGALGYKITVLWHSSKSYFRNCSDCSNQWPSSEKIKIVQNLISSSDAAMFCLCLYNVAQVCTILTNQPVQNIHNKKMFLPIAATQNV